MTTHSEGLDLSDLGAISKEEVDAYLAHNWRWRGALYPMAASSLMLDYAPDFAKLHRRGTDMFGRPDPVNVVLLSVANIHSYMMLGWEAGLHNEFLSLRRGGMPIAQTMELVMFGQLYSGMRGLGHVFHAVGENLPAYGPPPGSASPFPDGWTADPAAFRAGLDQSTSEMTGPDRANLVDWYERTLGYLPRSVKFGLRHHPEYLKVSRGKWEVAIKTLPKQVVPWTMLRHHTVTGSVDGLREAAALARAWGITKQLVVQGITGAAWYFTNVDGLYAAHDALADLLEAWE